jgi:hypothetical protein
MYLEPRLVIICGSVAAGHGEHRRQQGLIRSAVVYSSSTATGVSAPNSADAF